MSELEKIRNKIQEGALDAAHKISTMIQEHMPSSQKKTHVEKVRNSKEPQQEQGIGGV